MKARWVLSSCVASATCTFGLLAGLSPAIARHDPQGAGGVAKADPFSGPTKTTIKESVNTHVERSPLSAKSATRNTSTRSETTETELTRKGTGNPRISRSVTTRSVNTRTETVSGATKSVTTRSSTTKTEPLIQPSRTMGKADAETTDPRKAEPPIPLLVGRYEHAYYLSKTACDPPVRFFAAKFKPPLGRDDLKEDQAFELFQRKAEEANRVVEWNQFSLAPRGALDQVEIDFRQEWTLLGAFCPSCREHHWIAVGYDENSSRFRVYSNSRRKRTPAEMRERGWQQREILRSPRITPDIHRLGTAPIDEGGWFLESFDDPSGMRCCPCKIQLQLGLARPQIQIETEHGTGRPQAGVTFAYLAAELTLVKLVGDYVEQPIGPTTPTAVLKEIYDDQIQYYAVLVSAKPPLNSALSKPVDPALIKRAANFGKRVVLGKGMMLNYRASLKRQRLTDGSALILGVSNPSRDENRWFSVEGTPGQPLIIHDCLGYDSILTDGFHEVKTGGLTIKIRIDSDAEGRGDVEYMFLSPE